MTIWQKSQLDSQTIHVTGAMFLNAQDKVEVKFKSAAISDIKLLGESGFSIVKVTEEDQSASFSSFLNVRNLCSYIFFHSAKANTFVYVSVSMTLNDFHLSETDMFLTFFLEILKLSLKWLQGFKI